MSAACAATACAVYVFIAASRRTDQVPFVTSDVKKHGNVAIGFRARRHHELHACGFHPRVCGVEVLHVEEETHSPGSLFPDAGGLIFSVSPREQQACRGTWRAHYYPPLGTPVVREGRGVLYKLEAQRLHEEADGRVILADHDGNEAEMHCASIGATCLLPLRGRQQPNSVARTP
jgi:hypothetical protein